MGNNYYYGTFSNPNAGSTSTSNLSTTGNLVGAALPWLANYLMGDDEPKSTSSKTPYYTEEVQDLLDKIYDQLDNQQGLSYNGFSGSKPMSKSTTSALLSALSSLAPVYEEESETNQDDNTGSLLAASSPFLGNLLGSVFGSSTSTAVNPTTATAAKAAADLAMGAEGEVALGSAGTNAIGTGGGAGGIAATSATAPSLSLTAGTPAVASSPGTIAGVPIATEAAKDLGLTTAATTTGATEAGLGAAGAGAAGLGTMAALGGGVGALLLAGYMLAMNGDKMTQEEAQTLYNDALTGYSNAKSDVGSSNWKAWQDAVGSVDYGESGASQGINPTLDWGSELNNAMMVSPRAGYTASKFKSDVDSAGGGTDLSNYVNNYSNSTGNSNWKSLWDKVQNNSSSGTIWG